MEQRAIRLKATAIGFTAVLMWAALALLTALTGAVPPFQLLAMCFAIATLIACVFWRICGQNPLRYMRQKPIVWLLGVGGLFGYHFFYFVAIDNAPAVEASLIAYLWPLLIVIFSALLPGERLRWFHVAGALLGLGGAALLVTRGAAPSPDPRYSFGYGAACICAITWAGYSVLSRRFGSVPTEAVGGFCAVTALLGMSCHLAFEETVWPDGMGEWGAVVLLGLGPVGGAFFTWDYGVKHGDIQVLGASSYAAPLLSTILLIAAGLSPFTGSAAAACLLIVGGAVLASWAMLFQRR